MGALSTRRPGGARVRTSLYSGAIGLLLGLLVLATATAAYRVGWGQPYDNATSSGPRRMTPQTGPVTYSDISRHAEAHLYYPGSTIISRFGSGEQRASDSSGGQPGAAFAGGIATSNDTRSNIYYWYLVWMLKHGWNPHDFARATTWQSLEGFVRGKREKFIIAVDYPDLLSETLGRPVPKARTVYEINYFILPK